MSLSITRNNSMFENLFNDIFSDEVLTRPYMSDSNRRTHSVTNRDEDWQITFAIPGVKKEEVQIKVDDHVLTVSYDNKKTTNNYGFVSSFTRSWELDRGVDVSKITANHQDGILTIVVPKPESKKRVVRTIEVS